MLARLEAHVAEQQRFAANASHELRTPLAITQTLLEVARNDPRQDTDELIDRLHAVNARAIDLTEALLLLSRADRRTFTRDHVDLSLVAEEATETLLPLAEKHGVTIETFGEVAPTTGSHALLLQLTTNLLHNAIVHNLPDRGTVSVTTTAHPGSVTLTVENTGEMLTPQVVSTLGEPFRRGTERLHTDHAGAGLGLAIVKSITQAHDGALTLVPGAAGGLRITVRLPAAPPQAHPCRVPARSTPARDASSSRLRIAGVGIAGHPERRIGVEHASDLAGRELRAVGDHRHRRMDAAPDPDSAAIADRDPAGALRGVEQRGQDRPVGDRVRAVAHPLGLARRRRDRVGVHVIAAEGQRADVPARDELVEPRAHRLALAEAEPADAGR